MTSVADDGGGNSCNSYSYTISSCNRASIRDRRALIGRVTACVTVSYSLNERLSLRDLREQWRTVAAIAQINMNRRALRPED